MQNISLTSARHSSTSVNGVIAMTDYPIGTMNTCLGPTQAWCSTFSKNTICIVLYIPKAQLALYDLATA